MTVVLQQNAEGFLRTGSMNAEGNLRLRAQESPVVGVNGSSGTRRRVGSAAWGLATGEGTQEGDVAAYEGVFPGADQRSL